MFSKINRVATASSLFLLCGVSLALAQTPPATAANTSKGMVLVDAKGITLYSFDRDAAGKSNCNGQCATNWAPMAAAADAQPSGDWTIITRDDGSKQWGFKRKPLYTWKDDKNPGDVTGDGVNNVWHVVPAP
jgi:predicted lipoprotein with Yx(FWY)xxD motif